MIDSSGLFCGHEMLKYLASWSELLLPVSYQEHKLTLYRTIWCYSMWYGEKRPRWLGPLPYNYPAYLTGELPGDYGFDVAGLSKDPVAFQKYFK